MHILLHFTPDGAHYWQRDRHGWQPLDTPPPARQPVWVLTDLPGENFVDIELPALHGRNRSELVERQLIQHFPDTPWRTRLRRLRQLTIPTHQLRSPSASPLTQHTLFGIHHSESLNAELEQKNIQLAALTATSLLLTRIAQDKRLPDELLIVLPSDYGLRIVAIRQRKPLLTRLTPAQTTTPTEELVEEIERTRRHLTTAKRLHSETKPAILLLARNPTLHSALLAADYQVLAPPALWKHPQDSKAQPLFDLAIRRPVLGQLAPIARRQAYLAGRLRQCSLAASLLLALSSALSVAHDFIAYRELQHALAEQSNTLQQLHASVTALDQQLAHADFSAEQIRQGIQLRERKLTAPPAFEQSLSALADVLDLPDNLAFRLNSLDWQLADSPNPLCSANAGHLAALAELRLTLQLPASTQTPETHIRAISAHLAQWSSASLLDDPAHAPEQTTLQGSSASTQPPSHASWCLAWPADQPTNTPTDPQP